MGLCAALLHAMNHGNHWMLVPLAGTIAIVYVQPHSPVAQPWPVVGSYVLACLAGFLCSYGLVWPPLAAALGLALSVWLMVRLHCIHPPGAAMSLLIVLDGPHTGPGLVDLTAQVLLSLALVLASTWLISNLVLRKKYPYTAVPAHSGAHQTGDAAPMRRIGLVHADLESAIRSLDTFVDVQEEELIDIYNLAVDHAFGRHMGLTCADVMSRDVVTVHFDTALEEGWQQLRAHKIKSLPVVDAFGRLIGIVTVADFLRQIDDTAAAGLALRLQGLLQRTPGVTSDKAEVLGQIMTAQVFTAAPDTPIAALVAQCADNSLPHVPIIDAQRKVVGIVTQSDMLAALYQRIALEQAAATA